MAIALRRNAIFAFSLLFFILLYLLLSNSRSGGLLGTDSDAALVAAQSDSRLSDLRERLLQVEHQNKAKAMEMSRLKQQLQQAFRLAPHTNWSQQLDTESRQELERALQGGREGIRLPGAEAYLPHTQHNPDALLPAYQVTRGRSGVSVVIGLPTIKRDVHSYLMDTLQSLVDGLNDEERQDCVIVIFIGETNLDYVQSIANNIRERFSHELDSGLMEIISPPAAYYPDFNALKDTFGDTHERVRWRTKQNLDFSFLMMYAESRALYYVQLEDDIVAKPGYISTMKNFAGQQQRQDWFMLEFSQLGFIGKLFRTGDLHLVVEFFLMFHRDKPIDWLLDHILWVKICHPEKDAKHCAREKANLRIRFKPSLFQHVGTHSSLPGKIQKLKDRDFGKLGKGASARRGGPGNPEAALSTTIGVYQKYNLAKAYQGDNVFWGILPKAGDTISFTFNSPLLLASYKFVSGNPEHPGDQFANTTLEVRPTHFEHKKGGILENQDAPSHNRTRTADGWIILDHFKRGRLENQKVDGASLGEIGEMRLHVQTDLDTWVILSEIHIQPVKTR